MAVLRLMIRACQPDGMSRLEDLLGGTRFDGARHVGFQENLVTGVTNYLGWTKAHTTRPSGIGVHNPQISVKDDNFLCEVVEYALKTIAHPLSFFQEPTPVVPRDHQTKAKADSQGQMIQD